MRLAWALIGVFYVRPLHASELSRCLGPRASRCCCGQVLAGASVGDALDDDQRMSGEAQADCHLLSLPDGTYALIDAADAVDAPGTALAYLQKHQIKRLALVVQVYMFDRQSKWAKTEKQSVSLRQLTNNTHCMAFDG